MSNGIAELVLPLLKANLGISSDKRDTYLIALLDSIVSELADKGIHRIIKEGSDDHDYIMLVIDYASFQYRKRGEESMPRNIQYRIRNRIIKGVVGTDE